MSSFVLSRLLPASGARFRELAAACREAAGGRFALAELNTLLSGLTAGELQQAVADPPPAGLPAFPANYVAAMVEYACARSGLPSPGWTATEHATKPFLASHAGF